MNITTNDRISDSITRIRNAQMVKMLYVRLPLCKLNVAIAEVLRHEGYIKDYDVVDKDDLAKFGYVSLTLKYTHGGLPAIREIKRISKPGKRIYSRISDLRKYRNGFGTYVLSTSSGVKSDRQARVDNHGGEVLFKVF